MTTHPVTNNKPLCAIAGALACARRILICAHVKPDGDAVGSSLALCRMLRATGREADAFLPDPIPAKFAEDAAREGFLREVDFARYDAAVLLDTPRPERLALGGAAFDALPAARFAIDHHGDHQLPGCTLDFAAPAAATAVHIARLAEAGNWPVDAETANWLLTSLMTDTGGFRFGNADKMAFETAAKLVGYGAEPAQCADRIYFSKPLNQQLFEADLVTNYRRFYAQGRISTAVLTRELLAKHRFDMRDGEGLIDLLREVEGVELACLVYPVDGGSKLSLRSSDPALPVVEIAHLLGGGGHALAAGVLMKTTPPETAEQLAVAHLERLLAERN